MTYFPTFCHGISKGEGEEDSSTERYQGYIYKKDKQKMSEGANRNNTEGNNTMSAHKAGLEGTDAGLITGNRQYKTHCLEKKLGRLNRKETKQGTREGR